MEVTKVSVLESEAVFAITWSHILNEPGHCGSASQNSGRIVEEEEFFL